MAHLDEWFVGYEHAHGEFTPEGRGPKGKTEGVAVTREGPATRALWDGHLSAKGPGIGLIPLLEDDTVRFGAADVDNYAVDLMELSARVKDTNLVLFRSKSGGAHLVCFAREPIPVQDMLDYLNAMVARLGYSGCEIFPKQTKRSSPADKGNWINMPYANAAMTQRYAIQNRESLDLEQCLTLIEHKALSAADFMQVEEGQGLPEAPPTQRDGRQQRSGGPRAGLAEPTGERFSDGPPCLQHLAEVGGFGAGVRNEGMFNVGVYVKKAYPDNWRDKLLDFRDMCDPPMDITELHKTVEKSLNRKDYSYRCTEQPIAPHCNRPLCLRRPNGVGQASGGGARLGSITKYEGTPVLWVMEVDGKRLELNTEDLQNQTAFGRRCMEVLTVCPKPVPNARWLEYLHEELKKANVVPAMPDEETVEGHFWVLLERFCTLRAGGADRDSVTSNYPFTETGVTWFRLAALLEYLARVGFRYKNNREITKMLKEQGALKAEWDLREGRVHVWGIPAFKQREELDKKLPDLGSDGDEF